MVLSNHSDEFVGAPLKLSPGVHALSALHDPTLFYSTAPTINSTWNSFFFDSTCAIRRLLSFYVLIALRVHLHIQLFIVNKHESGVCIQNSSLIYFYNRTIDRSSCFLPFLFVIEIFSTTICHTNGFIISFQTVTGMTHAELHTRPPPLLHCSAMPFSRM